MKILITGGAGFIARNLFEQLANEHTIISCTRQELDLSNSKQVFDFLRKNKFDVVIHTATYDAAPKYTTKDPLKVLENNLKMFFNIARCKDDYGKIIFFGSGAEYGREHWTPKMKEDYFDKHIPNDQYGFSKYIMTKYSLSSDNIYNLRLFGVLGKYDDWRTRFIPNACCHAIFDLPIKINQNRFFDHIDINDVIYIVKWFISNKSLYKVYNLCSGNISDFRTLAEKIVNISCKKLNVLIENEGLGQEYSGDNSLLLREIKDYKFTSIDESLKKLYEWYNLNKTLIDREKLI